MRYLFLIIMAVALVGCASTPLFNPNNKDHSVIEEAIRKAIAKPTGELTKADLKKVERLNLEYKNITDIGPVRALTNLYFLNISGMRLTDDQLQHLSGLTNLDLLALDGNPDLTGANLNELADLKKLRTLVLHGTKITEADVATLKKALPKCRIIHF